MPKYSHINFSPPETVRKAYKRGLELHKEGKTGKGLEASTVSMARKLASGSSVSPEWARKGNRFWGRNERFLDEPKDSHAYASAMLWGGRPGMSWFRKLYDQMKAADKDKSNNIQANVVRKEGGKWFVYSEEGKRISKGYSSKEEADKRLQQIEYFKMKGNQKLRCNVLTQVNAKNVYRDEKRGEIVLRNVCPIRDDVVMNGGLYSSEDIDRSYLSIDETLAPLGHPTDASGNFISAKSGQAVQNFYVGAVNRNVTKRGNEVLMDIVINVDQAKGCKRGPELLDRIQYMESSREPIHVSTGLMLTKDEVSGVNADGDEYTWIARNMEFDHVAILLDEPGAATPEKGVGIFANAEGQTSEVIVCNLNEEKQGLMEDEDDEIEIELPADKGTISKILDMLAKLVPVGNNNNDATIMPNSQEEEGEMKDFIIEQLLAANCGKTKEELEGMSDSDFKSFAGNAMKAGKDTAMDVNARMGKMDEAMNKMASSVEEMANRMDKMDEKYNAMYEKAEKEKEAKMNSLMTNAAKALGKEPEEMKDTPVEILESIVANSGQAYSVNSAYQHEGGQDQLSTEIPD